MKVDLMISQKLSNVR